VRAMPEEFGGSGGYASKRALVTGGLGFIGSHLAKRLLELGAEVTIVDSVIPECGGNPYNIREIEDAVEVDFSDLRDSRAMRRLVAGKDVVFNLAGQVSHIDSMYDPEADLDINCRAQVSLLEACREVNPDVRIAYAASRQQYGRPRFLPVTEDHPLQPVDVNGINLVAGEAYHLLYHDVYGMPTTSLRLTNSFGPHLLMKHSRQGFIAVFIRRAIEGEIIQLYGDGSQLRDFTYVTDVVDAFLAAAASDESWGEVFNIAGPEPISLLEVAEACQELADAGGGIKAIPWPAERKRIDVGSVYLDSTKLRQTTCWRPKVDLSTGLRETIEFYRAHGKHYWR
jgi:UDP-glucose 4-epimerase